MLRVLLLEDDENDVRLIEEQLVGLAAVVSCDTRAEFTQFLGEPIDVILVDMKLRSDPKFTGQEAMRVAAQKQPETPCIIVTDSYPDAVAAVECMKAGAVDYILKDRLGRLRQAVISANHNRETSAKREAKKKEDLLAEWSAAFVHDMRNALMVIAGGAELLRVQLDKTVSMIEQSAKHGTAMVEQLTIFARGNGAVFGPVSPVDLFAPIGHLIRSGSFEKIRVGITITAGTRNALCDATQIEQVLRNLIGNAREAVSLETGQILLTAQNAEQIDGEPFAVNGPYVLLSVSDNGCGIAEADLPKIWDAFWSAKPKNRGNTGMGLAIVKRIVDAHQGAVVVESSQAGTTFKVFLPAAT